MERSIPLGSLAGIRIGMSWTVPLIAFFYAISLANGSLPVSFPNEPSSSYWIAALIGSGLFFLSLLAHEMGHALVGRREGMGVKGITLTLLGGVTEFESEARSPWAELRVSGIGPLTNLALAGVFLALTQVIVADVGLVALVAEMLAWLAFVNLLLAGLNMLPGHPLDGGAVLGALVWRVTGDRSRAQRITAGLGMGLGGLLMLLGFQSLGRGGLGFWLLFLGFIIFTAARQQRQSAPALGQLRQVAIGQVMLPDPPLVPEWSTLSDVVARAQAWQPHTAFPVQAADGRITGLLTAELVLAVAPHDWPHVRAVDVAWPIERVATATVDEPVLSSLQRSDARGIDRILVLWPDGRVAGVAGADAGDRALQVGAPAP